MLLNGIDFGVVFNASGARGFYGEGWPFHKFLKPFGLNYEGSTFVSKTLTIRETAGNMSSSYFPECIKIYPRKQCVLNAVGLTNSGLCAWLENKNIPDTAVISIAGDEAELTAMIALIGAWKSLGPSSRWGWCKNIAIQINASCPNTNIKSDISKVLDSVNNKVPIIIKVGMHFDIQDVLKWQDHAQCSALAISNTIPWGHPLINWKYLFGSDISPLATFGGGGLSGKPLFPLMIDYLSSLRAGGWEKPIIAGGGILSTKDIDNVFHHGADAIELGSVSLLKPWRVQKLIQYTNTKYSNMEL